MAVVNEWDVPMFEVPDTYRPPARHQRFPIWREHKGKRISCDDCILDLARGHARFMAEPAKHVRTDEAGTRYYCGRHAHERKIVDR